jgi:hypothetical protein
LLNSYFIPNFRIILKSLICYSHIRKFNFVHAKISDDIFIFQLNKIDYHQFIVDIFVNSNQDLVFFYLLKKIDLKIFIEKSKEFEHPRLIFIFILLFFVKTFFSLLWKIFWPILIEHSHFFLIKFSWIFKSSFLALKSCILSHKQNFLKLNQKDLFLNKWINILAIKCFT